MLSNLKNQREVNIEFSYEYGIIEQKGGIIMQERIECPSCGGGHLILEDNEKGIMFYCDVFYTRLRLKKDGRLMEEYAGE